MCNACSTCNICMLCNALSVRLAMAILLFEERNGIDDCHLVPQYYYGRNVQHIFKAIGKQSTLRIARHAMFDKRVMNVYYVMLYRITM